MVALDEHNLRIVYTVAEHADLSHEHVAVCLVQLRLMCVRWSRRGGGVFARTPRDGLGEA